MQQFFEALSDFVNDHWIKFLTGLGLMAIGWFFGKRRARSEWQKREFYQRLNISLNIVQEGQPLRIRTILEKNCSEVFLNSLAVDAICAAARNTTEKNPILPLPEHDYWYYLNSVLNEIAEHFSVGEIRRDLGLPVQCGTYLVCLTSECTGEVRTRKIRAMVIRKEVLLKLPAERPPLELPNHATRWETLKLLAAEYQKQPHQFREVEICA